MSEKELREINHSLSDAARACFDVTKAPDFSVIGSTVDVFPSVAARYDAPRWTIAAIWEATVVAQYAAATVARLLSGHDIRKSCSNWTVA